MKGLSASEILGIWDQGRAWHPIDRAVLLLNAAQPGRCWGSLVDVPVGQRDAAIRQLRCATFGPEVRAILDCPNCNERLECTLGSDAFPAPASNAAAPMEFELEGWRFRVPTSRDLASIAQETDPERAARTLLRTCWVPESGGGLPDWSGKLMDDVEGRLAEVDPEGDVNLELNCGECGYAWQTEFDITGFFWAEIEAWVKRLLGEIHVLARAYGWSEREILGLSDARRTAYIDMVMA